MSYSCLAISCPVYWTVTLTCLQQVLSQEIPEAISFSVYMQERKDYSQRKRPHINLLSSKEIEKAKREASAPPSWKKHYSSIPSLCMTMVPQQSYAGIRQRKLFLTSSIWNYNFMLYNHIHHISYVYEVVRIFCSLVLHRGSLILLPKSLKIQLSRHKLMLNRNNDFHES